MAAASKRRPSRIGALPAVGGEGHWEPTRPQWLTWVWSEAKGIVRRLNVTDAPPRKSS